MKKSTLFAAGVAVVFGLSLGIEVHAQNYAPPVVVGSDTNQVQVAPQTKTMATDLRFFKHPRKALTDPAKQQNFTDKSPDGFDVKVGEKGIVVDDIAATPGLIPRPANRLPADGKNAMIDQSPERANKTLDPIHFFCAGGADPGSFAPGYDYIGIDCELVAPIVPAPTDHVACSETKDCEAHYNNPCYWFRCSGGTCDYGLQYENCVIAPNVTNHQLEVVDVRNSLAAADETFVSLLDDPLVAGVLADAQESVAPYEPATYPALVVKDKPFVWKWGLPNPGYSDAIAYGLADLSVKDGGETINNGLVTAIYDPISVEAWYQMVTIDTAGVAGYLSTDAVQLAADAWLANPFQHCVSNEFCDLGTTFLSPLAFFRADSQSGRMLLSGYSSILHLPKNAADEFSSLLHLMKNPSNLFVYLLSQNFNPVDVTAMKFGTDTVKYTNPTGTIDMTIDRRDGFAVLNQATVIDLDNLLVFGGKIQPGNPRWYQTILLDGKPLDGTLMPHRVVSYVVFWSRQEGPWGHSGTGTEAVDNPNPNYVYGPFKIALVGGGAFHSAELKDMPDEINEVSSLLVASGDAAGSQVDGGHFIYKINPTSDPKLKLIGGLELPIVHPRSFEVMTPEGGFAPYDVVTGELDGDARCGDMVLTFRGQETVYPAGNFKNAPGENVAFQSTQWPGRMFSDRVHVHFGRLQGGECAFLSAPDKILAMPAELFSDTPQPLAQVAAVAVADFDNDGTKDVLAGDLIPRQIIDCDPTNAAECAQRGLYTGFAYLFRDVANHVPGEAPSRVRVGKATATEADFSQAMLTKQWGKSVIGVGALAVDEEPGAEPVIAAINGLPLMLPPFGCPGDPDLDPTGVQVVSVPELILARMSGFPATPWHPLKPQRCYEDVASALDVMCENPNRTFLDESHPCCEVCTLHNKIPECMAYCRVTDSGGLTDEAATIAHLKALKASDPKLYDLCTTHYYSIYLNPDGTESLGSSGTCISGSNDTQDDDGDSAFACAWRPDEVVSPERGGLISSRALEPAANIGGIKVPDRGFDGGFISIPDKGKSAIDLNFTADPNARYPRGQIMSGPREMTVVLTKAPPPPVELSEGDCIVWVMGDMSKGSHEARMAAEKSFGSGVTGRPGHLFAGFGQPIEVYCHTPNASDGDTIGPSATIQTGGKLFMRIDGDPKKYPHKTILPGQKALIFPAPGAPMAMTLKGVSVDITPLLSGAVPMASMAEGGAVDYTQGAKSTMSLNDVLSRKQFVAPAGSSLSMGEGSAAYSLSFPTTGVVTKFAGILPPGCGSFFPDSNTCLVGVEPGLSDMEAVKTELLSRSAKDSSVYVGLPWAQSYNLTFDHLQSQTTGEVKNHKFAVLMGNYAQATGGGCGCVVGGVPPNVPTGLALLFAAAAVFMGLRWRMKK